MAKVDDLAGLGTFGVLISRLCPMTLAHQTLIEMLCDTFGERYLVFLGSANASVYDFPTFFDYRERAAFARLIFPDLRIAPMPDFGNHDIWFLALDDLLAIAGVRNNTEEVVYIGGSYEDVNYLHERKRKVYTVDRFDGVRTPPISGSEVRNALIERRPLDCLLDTRLHAVVRETFEKKWPEFLKHRG